MATAIGCVKACSQCGTMPQWVQRESRIHGQEACLALALQPGMGSRPPVWERPEGVHHAPQWSVYERLVLRLDSPQRRQTYVHPAQLAAGCARLASCGVRHLAAGWQPWRGLQLALGLACWPGRYIVSGWPGPIQAARHESFGCLGALSYSYNRRGQRDLHLGSLGGPLLINAKLEIKGASAGVNTEHALEASIVIQVAAGILHAVAKFQTWRNVGCRTDCQSTQAKVREQLTVSAEDWKAVRLLVPCELGELASGDWPLKALPTKLSACRVEGI